METRVYHARTTKLETKPQRKIQPFRSVVLDSAAQGAEVPACVVDVVMGGVEDCYLASVDVRNLQGVGDRRSQVQAEVVDREAASSVAADVDPVLGAGVALLQGGAETSDQDLVGKLEGGWLGWRDQRGLDRLALDHSFRQL